MNANNPILSIIVPVYNVENYIEECILSLLNQNIDNMEIIVVDDGSSDRSVDIVNSFRDSRIIILKKKNGGLSSARNFGLKRARGEYVAFVDSDDFISGSNSYREMIELVKKNDTDIVVGRAGWYYSKDRIVDIERDVGIFNKSVIGFKEYIICSIKANRIYVPVCFSIYKRSLIINKNINFYEGIYHEDELFTNMILLEVDNISLYNNIFYMYRQREGSIMKINNNTKRVNDIFLIGKILFERISKIKDLELRDNLWIYIAEMLGGTIIRFNVNNIDNEVRRIILDSPLSNKRKYNFKLALTYPQIYYFFIKIRNYYKYIIKFKRMRKNE